MIEMSCLFEIWIWELAAGFSSLVAEPEIEGGERLALSALQPRAPEPACYFDLNKQGNKENQRQDKAHGCMDINICLGHKPSFLISLI